MIFKPKTIQIEFDVSNLTLIEAEQAYRGLIKGPWNINTHPESGGVNNLDGTGTTIRFSVISRFMITMAIFLFLSLFLSRILSILAEAI